MTELEAYAIDALPLIAWASYCAIKTFDDFKGRRFWMGALGTFCTLAAIAALVWISLLVYFDPKFQVYRVS